jgi:hypothetical protein
MKPVNPSTEGWLTYYDSDQGLALFRNQFKDENDIVAGFTATARRVRGHQGNDNLGFRILGLGSIWVVGAGRTDQVGGQSTLFPVSDIAHLTAQKGALGKVLATHFDEDGSGAISASGSCMGVLNHQRSLQVDYSRESGAAAVFIINDHSDNGRVWRMNSPIFNDLRINQDGFSLVSPQGAELRATVFTDIPQLNISSGKLRYGGATTRLNRGIEYRGKSYDFTHAIDCKTNGNICVVLTLQPKGKAQPVVQRVAANKIMVGSKLYFIR